MEYVRTRRTHPWNRRWCSSVSKRVMEATHEGFACSGTAPLTWPSINAHQTNDQPHAYIHAHACGLSVQGHATTRCLYVGEECLPAFSRAM